jgi:hypothetical protein
MATMFRALVMLAVLVGLPAAWVYYGPLPPEGQRVVDRLVSVAKEAIGWEKTATSERADSLPATGVPPAWRSAAAAGVDSSAKITVNPIEPNEAPPLVAPRAPTFAERVEPLLARLREFGVVAYDLEPWGTTGKLYRFHCEMPLGASAQLTQQFEAVADDPQATVEQVVAQVAQWQTDRQRAGM